ncbi:MAG: hypothetical protein LBM07_04745, partial [Culturomica sp.]|nr:hypothetical protein [Culturomica sp.]
PACRLVRSVAPVQLYSLRQLLQICTAHGRCMQRPYGDTANTDFPNVRAYGIRPIICAPLSHHNYTTPF